MEDTPYDFIDPDAPEKRDKEVGAKDIPTRGKEKIKYTPEVHKNRVPSYYDKEAGSSNNNSNSNRERSDRGSKSINSDNPRGGNRPLLLRLLNRLFKLFE